MRMARTTPPRSTATAWRRSSGSNLAQSKRLSPRADNGFSATTPPRRPAVEAASSTRERSSSLGGRRTSHVWLIVSRALTRGDLGPSRARRSGAGAVSEFELLANEQRLFSPLFSTFLHLAFYPTWCYRFRITVLGRQPGSSGSFEGSAKAQLDTGPLGTRLPWPACVSARPSGRLRRRLCVLAGRLFRSGLLPACFDASPRTRPRSAVPFTRLR